MFAYLLENTTVTQDIELFEKNEQDSSPPLCLVHYFGATGQGPPNQSLGHIAEREGNLLILEFAPPPKPMKAKRLGQSILAKAYNALFLLLLLVSLIACIAAFRF